MNFSRFFIDRPIFAGVLSVLIFVAGLIALRSMPIAEYPEVAPPQVVVTANYPGANPKVIAATVATPIEEAINGVEGMLYMSSQATTDGLMTLTVTFALGTDADKATQLVQNRVSQAEPRLPEEVRRLGVTTIKSSPNFIMVVHLLSPNDRYDITYLRNYGVLNLKDRLARVPGVGQVSVFGAGDYSMRVWLQKCVNIPAALAEARRSGDSFRRARDTLDHLHLPFSLASQKDDLSAIRMKPCGRTRCNDVRVHWKFACCSIRDGHGPDLAQRGVRGQKFSYQDTPAVGSPREYADPLRRLDPQNLSRRCAVH